jgi:chromosome segregation ATPase
MSDFDSGSENRGASGLFLGAVIIALLAAIGGLGWSFSLQKQLSETQQNLQLAQQQTKDLSAGLSATNARLTATVAQTSEASQQAIEERAQEIMRREQAHAKEQINSVSNQVSAVQSDVGGVKTDVGGVKQDLADTKTRLQSVMGDAGVMSGLIAKNHDELEILKHKGDRNYYEFTLTKGAKPTLLSTISLQLRKSDEKHSKFTLEVMADDKKIEKKDRNLNEPMQFYSGKDPMLYELVVNNITKNTVVGYLSTPKNAPQITAP